MSRSSDIEINFQAAQRQATELEVIADNMRHLAEQQMADAVQGISSCWRGESAAAYLVKAEKVRQDIADTAKELYETASSIRAQAKRIYDAEMQAIALAQSEIK